MVNLEGTSGLKRASLRLKARAQILTGLMVLVMFLPACTRSASRAPQKLTPGAATGSVPQVRIDQVQVSEGSGIFVTGHSTLPDGECIKTELLADQQPAAWWPNNICIEVAAGQWEILAALGKNGAPTSLNPTTLYQVHAWWPRQPGPTSTRFPFDLSGPKSP